jgi:5-methylcytosine-specific restriction endonuclease McrA
MYQITQEQRDRYNANRRAKKAKETPEERENRLSKRREYERLKRIEGGEALRRRTREQALAWVNKKRAEDPDWESKRYKKSKLKKEQLASERAATLKEGEKLCPRCLFVRAIEDFPMTRAGQRASVCKKCFKVMTGAYDFDSPSYWTHKANAVYQRAKRTDGVTNVQHVTGDELRNLFETQGHKCAYCGIELTPLILAIDHKIPKSKGGSHTIENLQLVCHNCNISKFTMTDEEYRKYIL